MITFPCFHLFFFKVLICLAFLVETLFKTFPPFHKETGFWERCSIIQSIQIIHIYSFDRLKRSGREFSPKRHVLNVQIKIRKTQKLLCFCFSFKDLKPAIPSNNVENSQSNQIIKKHSLLVSNIISTTSFLFLVINLSTTSPNFLYRQRTLVIFIPRNRRLFSLYRNDLAFS